MFPKTYLNEVLGYNFFVKCNTTQSLNFIEHHYAGESRLIAIRNRTQLVR